MSTNIDPTGMIPPELQKSVNVLYNWWMQVKSYFPSAEIIDINNRTNSFTIKIKSNDVFRHYYIEIKKQLQDSKVSLVQCEFSQYNECMLVRTNKIVTNWEQYYLKPQVISGAGEYYYYFPIENLFDAFSEIWKKQNEGKPMLLRFYHRKSGEKPYIYIKITVPQNMGNVKQLGG